MPRRKSTATKTRQERVSVEKDITAVAETIETDERALLLKLKKRYENEETGERIPGKLVHGQKTIWTYKDCLDRYEVVSFIPEETIPLNFNGVKVQAFSGIEMHVPKCFKKVYDDHRKALRPESPPPGVTVELGAGPLPPR